MAETQGVLDVCIVGAGPAGLQTAYFLREKGMRIALLERTDAVSGFFRKFPRQRNLISINKVNTGLSDPEARLRYDWNSLLGDDETPLFTAYSRKYFPKADVLVDYLDDFAEPLRDIIHCNKDAVRICKADTGYAVHCADGSVFEARQIVVSTGVTLPWLPELKGLDLVEQYTTYDPSPERFDDKRVLILGKGNAAFETAESLIEHAQAIHVMSPQPIKFAWNTHFVGHVRAVNTNFIDTYQLKSQNAVIDAEAQEITRDADGTYHVSAT
ncbi:MAG: NAD(P)-binding domain-containing protein, partial [Rhodobacteraceae bacterium]|nr:NAD(P)-binding domain-containing protein [Paracoccaceae bacterium]